MQEANRGFSNRIESNEVLPSESARRVPSIAAIPSLAFEAHS